MKKILIALSMLLTLSFSATGVAAQVTAPNLAPSAAYDVEGLQSVYDRTFSVDFAAMMEDPDVDLESLDTSALAKSVSIQGMTFDSEDSANAYMDTMVSQMDEAIAEDPETFEDIEISEIEDMDVDGLKITMDMADLEMAAVMYVFTDGNHVFQVMSFDGNLDGATATADAVTQFVVDAEIENEEVTFSNDGTSTGGVFDTFPTTDDEVVGDLSSAMDTELFVAGAE